MLGSRHEQPVPNVTPWTVAEIMAQPSNFDAFYVPVCESELWLVSLQVCDEEAAEVSDA